MAGTGVTESADYFLIYDTARAARSGEMIKDGSVSRPINRSVNLSDFSTKGRDDYSPRSVLNSLGSRFTSDFYNNDNTNDVNTDLLKIDKKLVDKMVFTGYLDGSDLLDVMSFSDSGGEGLSSRTTTSLGLALGERFVINPQPQFNKRDDPRTNPYRSKIGRVYAEYVMNNWPIAIFQPGSVKYKLGFLKLLGIGTEGGNAESLIRNGDGGLARKILRKIILAPVNIISTGLTLLKGMLGMNKIVEFKPAINLFNKYMSGLMQTVAVQMNLVANGATSVKDYIGDSPFQYVGAIDRLNFLECLPGHNMGRHDYNQFIGVRCSNGIGVTEQFSNSTRENPLMEKMNQQSMDSEDQENGDGGAGGFISKMFSSVTNMKSFNIKSLAGAAGGALLGSGIVKKKLLSLAGNFSEQALVMSGKSRLVLPEIWSESSFSRSFSFSFKFHAPYGNSLCIFENTFYPFLFFLTAGTARQTGKMSYTSPFYIRVSVRSLIQIDYGIITSMSVTRGSEINDWTPEGFPKTIQLDVDIKDMTPNISLPLATSGVFRGALETIFPTSGMSEYLGTLCGLSLQDYHWTRRIGRMVKLAGVRLNAKWFSSSVWASTLVNNPTIYKFYSFFNAVDMDRISRDPTTGMNLDAEALQGTGTGNDQEERLSKAYASDAEYMGLGPGFARDSPGNYGLSKIVTRSNEMLNSVGNTK